MIEEIMLLLYLDQNLIRDLHSTIIDGYIESETVRYSVENENCNNFRFEIEKGLEKDIQDKISCENECEAEVSVSDKKEHKKDVEHKKIYFSSGDDSIASIKFFYSSWYKMHEMQLTRNIDQIFCNRLCIGNCCKSGDFIDFHGELTPLSLVGYISKLIHIIEAYTPEKLDEIVLKEPSFSMKGYYNFTIVLKLLTQLQSELNDGGTEDFIVDAESYSIIINVCRKEFDARHLHIYDSCSCKCRIWGKVCKIIDDTDSIKLLRKTGQVEYYERLLKAFEPYFNCLRANNILLPTAPPLNITGPSIIVKALSINL